MASDHTRSAILTAAERLYADRGFSDVTLRDIVAEAGVNLAAVNYHFGSKDELIAELFVTRSIATNRERLRELKAAEEQGGGRAPIEVILRALVGPTLRGCLGPENQRSTAARDAWWYCPTTSRHSSASSCCESAVEPTRSQNRMVSWRRSPAGNAASNSAAGVGSCGADAAGGSRVPQPPQNFSPDSFDAPHAAHRAASATPHSAQKRRSARFSRCFAR